MKYLILIYLIPLNSHAIFQKLYRGHKQSKQVESLSKSLEINQIDFDFGQKRFAWQLELGADHTDSFLQALFSFQSNRTITDTFAIGLSKQTFEYGNFSVQHQRINYDISNWSTTAFNSFSADTLYEARNSVSYSYDFLKQPLKIDWSLIGAKKVSEDLGTSVVLEKDALQFFQSYIETKLRVVLNRLYREFEKRAMRRVSLVKRRVRDGLGRSLDLDQAQVALLTRQETIEQNKTLMMENVYLLESIVGYEVPESSYIGIDWQFISSDLYPQVFHKNKYIELERLQALNDVLELELEKLNVENKHSLQLQLSYTKNSVNEAQADALNDSFGTSENDEKVIQLQYSFPFGGAKERLSRKKLLLQRSKNLLDQHKLESDYKAKERSLTHNVRSYEKAIGLSRKKIDFAKSSMQKSQKLYLRGQSSFEELLSTEETYINAEISMVNLLALYEGSLGQLAYLNGQLNYFLERYKD